MSLQIKLYTINLIKFIKKSNYCKPKMIILQKINNA